MNDEKVIIEEEHPLVAELHITDEDGNLLFSIDEQDGQFNIIAKDEPVRASKLQYNSAVCCANCGNGGGNLAKYRKKPVVIEAFQLNDRGLIGEDWFWDAVSRNDIITHNFGKYYPEPAYCEIKTLEGVMTARSGDYIIKGVQGEIYPCKSDIFEATYEKVVEI